MPVSPKETESFLDALFRNKLSEAEKILAQLETKHPEDGRYIHALKGIYQSYVGEDRDSLLYMLFLNEEFRKRQAEIRRSMDKFTKLFGGDDRFFEAWIAVLESLKKLPKPVKITSTSEG